MGHESMILIKGATTFNCDKVKLMCDLLLIIAGVNKEIMYAILSVSLFFQFFIF